MRIGLVGLSIFILVSISACVKPPAKKQSKEESIINNFKKEEHADGSISIDTSKRLYK